MTKQEETPVNYIGQGRWHFETDINSGHYELEVTPHLFYYTLLIANGKKIEGTIPGLLSKIEYYHKDPELVAWIKEALSWDHRDNNFKNWDRKESFIIDGVKYSVEFNPRTGELLLHFPARIIVSSRVDIGDTFPEIYSIKKGMLQNTIISELAKSDRDFTKITSSKKDIPFPLSSTTLIEYDLEGLTIWLNYDSTNDVIFLHVDSRSVHTHVSSIDSDLWEYQALHVGKYKEKLENILLKNGMVIE